MFINKIVEYVVYATLYDFIHWQDLQVQKTIENKNLLSFFYLK